MVNKKSALFTVFCLVFGIFISAGTVTGQSHEEATPIGGSVTTQINCSKRAGGIEVYDATITLLEVLRGSKAWELIKKADASSKKPETEYEYVLARVSYKMKARGAPGDKTFDLDSPLQFTAFDEGRTNNTLSLVKSEYYLTVIIKILSFSEGLQ